MDYYSSLGLPESEILKRMPTPQRFNVAPGTRPLAFHSLTGDDKITAEGVLWSYHSGWAKKEGRGPDINAKAEKALGSYWKPLWSKGRMIIPADGWYEWTGEKPNKQPWHIRAVDEQPLFIAAVSNWQADPAERKEDAGFAIVTAAAIGGMVDIHARRPIVFAAKEALEWMDLSFSAEHAENLARTAALTAESFEWYPVTKAVGYSKNDGPEMVKSLDPSSFSGPENVGSV
jgi:putative SOS response-associated peptidase YedK